MAFRVRDGEARRPGKGGDVRGGRELIEVDGGIRRDLRERAACEYVQNETRRSSGILRYLPRERRDEQQRKMRLLRITARPGGEVRARRSQLLRNCTNVLASTELQHIRGRGSNTHVRAIKGEARRGRIGAVESRNGYLAR